jgi:hypothetical protein
MNKRSKLSIGIGSVVLAGTLAFGAVASADNGGTGGLPTQPGRHHLTTQQRCDHKDQIETKAKDALAKIADRTAILTQKRADAVTAGDTAKVARIDKRLARLADISTRITTRLAKFETWVTTNCTS